VYLIGIHDLFRRENGYARLGETIIVNSCNVFQPLYSLMTSHIRGHIL
jgi:hypothetical protein